MIVAICPYVSTVCSTTLWVGQVDKKATQQDLTNLFEEFGQIESINVSISCYTIVEGKKRAGRFHSHSVTLPLALLSCCTHLCTRIV